MEPLPLGHNLPPVQRFFSCMVLGVYKYFLCETQLARLYIDGLFSELDSAIIDDESENN